MTPEERDELRRLYEQFQSHCAGNRQHGLTCMVGDTADVARLCTLAALALDELETARTTTDAAGAGRERICDAE